MRRLAMALVLALLFSGCGLVKGPDEEVYMRKHSRVHYYVEGSAKSAIIVVGTPNGEEQRVIKAPIRENVEALKLVFTYTPGQHVYVYVRNLGAHGLVRCIIKVNGYQEIRRSSADPKGNAKCDANV